MKKFEISSKLPDRRQEFHDFIQELKLVCVVDSALDRYLQNHPKLVTIDTAHEFALRSFLYSKSDSKARRDLPVPGGNESSRAQDETGHKKSSRRDTSSVVTDQPACSSLLLSFVDTASCLLRNRRRLRRTFVSVRPCAVSSTPRQTFTREFFRT